MWLIAYWVFPAISALMWLGMLLGMLITWVTAYHHVHYPSMEAGQSIAYISDIGAFQLKPLFISGSVITVVFLDIGFVAERWLRHTGRLAKNTSTTQKVLSIFSTLSAITGAAGLILLSNFDTYRHSSLHDVFLLIFIAGYVISAIFLCAEYQRLGIHYRHHRILAISFWIKLAFIIVEVILAIVFVSTSYTHHRTEAAIFEWIIAFVFTFYVLSFVLDLLPSVRTKRHIPQGHKDMVMSEQGISGAGIGGVTLQHGRLSQQSTRQGSYEQNLTNDSAGPNRGANKYVVEGQGQPRGGTISRLFSNLR